MLSIIGKLLLIGKVLHNSCHVHAHMDFTNLGEGLDKLCQRNNRYLKA